MKPVYILHLETSTKACSVAISKNGMECACTESIDEEYSHGEKLTIYVQEVMKKAQIQFSDLSAVSVASGPGSYTGLRIGTSTAKGFCYALQIPLLSITSLESLFELAKEKYPEKRICTMLDARRMEVFSAVYDDHGKEIKNLSADILDEDSYKEFEPLVLVGDAVMKVMPIWRERNLIFDLDIFCSARGQIKRIYEKFQAQDFEDLAYFEPYYLKDFMAIKPKSTGLPK